ncbi:hypothetical protein AX769_00290 [Frondihabitans sp. PAMC 28766]|uniref:hypothetical protein n=1 Tax=Frondihabitans sp. PAMC 28766 TaxID=1795630 RepID=UPI00078E6EAC|nr:hypothetical protein [Frondihabitans sp. PAMC 28766]AMM18862.1 hypothetical protein AX769_00290 [Frondihabitans sp. PAMC 28766]
MPEPVEVGYVAYMLSADYLATVGADFDSEKADDAILKEVNRLAPDGVTVSRNGKAFAPASQAEAARGIDWDAILTQIDVDQILADTGR